MQIKKYRKKPIVIEAFHFTKETLPFVLHIFTNWGLTGWHFTSWLDGERAIRIHTLEGESHCKPNDYVIKGVEGEFYVCDKEIFEKTYDLEDEQL